MIHQNPQKNDDAKQRLLDKLNESDFDAETVDILIARNLYGQQFTESLQKYISMRIEIEQNYADALFKLSDHAFPHQFPVMKKAVKHEVESHSEYYFLRTALHRIQADLESYARKHSKFAETIENEVCSLLKSSLVAQGCTKATVKSTLLDNLENYREATKKLAKMESDTAKALKSVKFYENKAEKEKTSQTAASSLARYKAIYVQALQSETKMRTSIIPLKNKFKDLAIKVAERTIDSESKRINASVTAIRRYARIIESQCEVMDKCAHSMASRSEPHRTHLDPGAIDRVGDGDLELCSFCSYYIYPTLKPLEEDFKKISCDDHTDDAQVGELEDESNWGDFCFESGFN